MNETEINNCSFNIGYLKRKPRELKDNTIWTEKNKKLQNEKNKLRLKICTSLPLTSFEEILVHQNEYSMRRDNNITWRNIGSSKRVFYEER